MRDETAERLAINDLICRFFQSFDEKDWTAMRDCLADRVLTDYSSFRAVPPAEIEGERYVEQRRAALSTLAMQHNFLNLRVEIDGDAAAARCNYIIYRFAPDHDGSGDDFFHSYGHYKLALARRDGRWRIGGITQVLLRNHGNAELHGATRSQDNTRNA